MGDDKQEKELKFYDNTMTKVRIGQSVCVGNRLRYSAVSLPWDNAGHFIDILPEDIGIFLGHLKQTKSYGTTYGAFEQVKMNEVAIFPRVGKVMCAEGVLEPVQRPIKMKKL